MIKVDVYSAQGEARDNHQDEQTREGPAALRPRHTFLDVRPHDSPLSVYSVAPDDLAHAADAVAQRKGAFRRSS